MSSFALMRSESTPCSPQGHAATAACQGFAPEAMNQMRAAAVYERTYGSSDRTKLGEKCTINGWELPCSPRRWGSAVAEKAEARRKRHRSAWTPQRRHVKTLRRILPWM